MVKRMKTGLLLLLVLALCFGICGCGDNSIALTKDNFDDYFDYSINLIENTEYERHVQGSNGSYFESGIGSKGQLTGRLTAVSQNYSYSDITMRVKVTASCSMVSKEDMDRTYVNVIKVPVTYETVIQVDLNVAGEGKITDTGYYTAPSDLLIAYTLDTSIEIIEITGSVTPLR